ncbi:MAG TPA: 3-dehydroquinate synthase [Pyrinomonadaceae bacterium]|nr:3-dehydroquinate synthase [Pyrinomonadaceae bacterium]
MEKISIKLEQTPHRYDIEIGHDLLENSGEWAKNNLSQKSKKIVIVSNAKVFRLYGEIVQKSLKKSGFEIDVFLMGDGERYKNFRVFEKALGFFSQKNLKRTDAVVALGGGVVGDLAGFAAAAYLRGVAFLQIPTTLLSMIDSSVGGKTAVNTAFGKNLIGAFHQPNGVLIDVKTLQTLPTRELTAGFCEAVKQGAISNESLFNQTADFLKNYSPNKFKNYFAVEKFLSQLESIVSAQIKFKAQIVMQDERESAERIDAKSRKILNFGHTFAHALEKITGYKRFKHGEAVGYGILFAAQLSKNLAILDKNRLKSLNDVVYQSGNLPDLRGISSTEVFGAFAFDKKQIGESLQWILLEDIGKPIIRQDISASIVKKTLEEFIGK